jgi:hypothetical protein
MAYSNTKLSTCRLINAYPEDAMCLCPTYQLFRQIAHNTVIAYSSIEGACTRYLCWFE